jgi:stage V sporulation protein G
MTEGATTVVTFTVTEVEQVRGAGRLVALAKVELELDGVVLVMQGVRVMRDRDGIAIQPPRFRAPRTGDWIPALLLPDELGQAIARELHQILLSECGSSPAEAIEGLQIP